MVSATKRADKAEAPPPEVVEPLTLPAAFNALGGATQQMQAQQENVEPAPKPMERGNRISITEEGRFTKEYSLSYQNCPQPPRADAGHNREFASPTGKPATVYESKPSPSTADARHGGPPRAALGELVYENVPATSQADQRHG